VHGIHRIWGGRKEQLVSRTIINRIGAAAIAGCIAVGALAGCGGGGSTTSATGASGASGASGSAPLSKDEFVSQANAICKEGNTKVEALKAPPSGGPPSGFVPYLEQTIAIQTPLVGQLEALTPPSNLQSDWDKLIADAKQKQALANKALDAAKANDTSQFTAVIQQLQAMSGSADPLARSIGLAECAKHPTPQG
jgi:hypothetical protein